MDQKKEALYEIGGSKFIQRPLVIGQMKQLRDFMKDLVLPANINTVGIITMLGDRISEAAAIVLIPIEGDELASLQTGKLASKDLKALTDELEFSMDAETALKVVEDFFDCNPIASILERLTGMVGKVTMKMTEMKSTILSPPLPEETSQSEIASSGDTVSKSVDPISNIDQEKSSSEK